MILEGLHEKEILTGNSPLRVAVNTEYNFKYPFHWHNAVELVYAAENGCTVNVNNRDYPMEEKDILLIAAGDIHNFQTGNRGGKVYFIQFDFTKLDNFDCSGKVRPYLSHTVKIYHNTEKELHTALEMQITGIINEYDNHHFSSALFLNARVLDIIVLLSRGLTDKIKSEAPQKRICKLEKLDKAFQYIEANYQNNITLKDVAKAAGFSEYHFSRIFKEISEKSFHHYLNEYRVKKAEKLLIGMGTTIAQAAHDSGFNSIVTFNRMFKQYKGCSPSAYLKMRV